MKSSILFPLALAGLFISVVLNLALFSSNVLPKLPPAAGSSSAQPGHETLVRSTIPSLLGRPNDLMKSEPAKVSRNANPVAEDPVRLRDAAIDEAIQKAGDLLQEYASNFPEEERDQLIEYIERSLAAITMVSISNCVETLPSGKRLEPMAETLRGSAVACVRALDGRVNGVQHQPIESDEIDGEGWTYQDLLDAYEARGELITHNISEVSKNLPPEVYESLRYCTKLLVEEHFLRSLEAGPSVNSRGKDDDE